MALHDGQYLDGFWQSEKYFIDIKSIIRNEFKVDKFPEGKNKQVLEQIESCQSIGIHIRRGDYAEKPSTNNEFGLYSMNYYQRALEILIDKIEDPHLFVFSDESQWVEKNFHANAPCTIVYHNNEAVKSFEDLSLMSHCKHNIIARSKKKVSKLPIIH